MGYMACGHVQNIPESIYVLTLFQAFKSAGTTNSVWGQLELSKTDSWMDTTDILWGFKAERRSMTYLLLKYAMSTVASKSFTKSHFGVLSSRRLCNKGFKHSGWNYHWLSSSSFLFQLSFTSPSLNLFFWKIFQVASSPVIFILLLPAAAHSLMSTTK